MLNPPLNLDRALRLEDHLLSLAWAHLHLLLQEPHSPLPTPKELQHLTQPEWELCSLLLDRTLWLKDRQPLH